MASLQKFKVDGKYYWRIVESKRINGKPRPIPVMYLGSADNLLERLKNNSQGEIKVKSFEHGALAAIKVIIDELDLIKLIDNQCNTPGVGEAMVLIAMNRLIAPCSKNSWSDWAKQTSINQFFPHLDINRHNSQYFWKKMHALPLDKIPVIEDQLVKTVVNHFHVKLETLFLDTTNCYTYIRDHNTSCEIPRYGKSKEKRVDKRLFGVALMVSKEDEIPLYHHTIPGNQHDSKEFPVALKTIRSRLEKMKLRPTEITIAFDRGFNSHRNFKLIEDSGVGFVAALRIGDVTKELFETPLRRFKKFKKGELSGLSYYRTKCQLEGIEYTAVLYISETLRGYQVEELDKQLAERIKELEIWQQQIMDHVSMVHHYDSKIVERKIKRLLTGNFIQDILSITYDPKNPPETRLEFSVDFKAKANIIRENYGKRVLITNRHQWDSAQIVQTYFNLAGVEHAFRACKDPYHIRMRPQFHWTDHNITIHTFTCFLALLLGRLLLKKAKLIDSSYSMQSLIDSLRSVRLATVITSDLSCRWKLEEMDLQTKKLFSALVPSST